MHCRLMDPKGQVNRRETRASLAVLVRVGSGFLALDPWVISLSKLRELITMLEPALLAILLGHY